VTERIDQLMRDLENQAKSISVIVLDQREMKDELSEFREAASKELRDIDKREAVRIERDKHLDDRLDRIEASIKAVYGLGKWILAAVGSVLVYVIVTGALKGGPLG
jgi:hypothetical protein